MMCDDRVQVTMDQLMDFAPVGLMSIIHSFAKMVSTLIMYMYTHTLSPCIT
jgi:hypothetical protein